MVKDNSGDLMRLAVVAGLGVGGYFIWKKYFKEEEEPLTGFQALSIEFPTNAMVGKTINGIIIGKNYENESYLCSVLQTLFPYLDKSHI